MEAIVAGTASLPSQVVKRDGSLKPFDAAKILAALSRAGAATGEFSIDEARRITANVLRVLALRFTQRAPSIEIIQDCVEQQLAAAGRFTTARAYIVYREQHQKLREDRRTLLDVESSVNEYLEQQDWRVNANANQGYSLGGLILNVAGKVTANIQSQCAVALGHADAVHQSHL